MKFVCIQSGHQGRNSGATGAPGEIELNVRIRNRLSQILISKGFMLQLVNADPSDAEINKDFDLFLTLHGDANIYGTGGGMVDYPEPDTDLATAESQRIARCIVDEYFPNCGIVNHPERTNANTRYYYMWRRLSVKTPCVLVEMGVVQDAHDRVILADTDRVANALARGICRAFGVTFDLTTTTTTTTSTSTSTSTTTTSSTTVSSVTTQPPAIVPSTEADIKLKAIYDVLWGKGWPWTKVNKIRVLLPK